MIRSVEQEGREKDKQNLAPFPCGVVLFDTPSEPGAGTAFLPDTPAQRIRSMNDLRNDALWLSNGSMFDAQIKSHPVVRAGFFFKLAINDMAQDVGLQTDSTGNMPPEDAQKLAAITTRAMTIAARAYDWCDADKGIGTVQEVYLSSDIAKELPRAPLPDARWRDNLRAVFTQSYQEGSTPDWSSYQYEPNSVFYTLRFNAVTYFKQLLNQPVPQGMQWSKMDESAVRLLDDPVAHCIALNKPCFVRVSVEWDNASSTMAALAAYGQAGKRKNPMRLWMSQPELAWLSEFATITISEIWVDESGMGKLPRRTRLPDLFSEHPSALLSYSSHLVAFNHYQAVVATSWNKRSRSTEAGLWGAWIKALDRAYMFSMALRAHEQGFHVVRYGDGALRVRINKDEIDTLKAFKHDNGFMYPELNLALIAQ